MRKRHTLCKMTQDSFTDLTLQDLPVMLTNPVTCSRQAGDVAQAPWPEGLLPLLLPSGTEGC